MDSAAGSESVVGRDALIAACAGALAPTPGSALVVVLQGPEGVGKTTVWRQVVANASRPSPATAGGTAIAAIILSVTTVPSEALLDHVVLADILDQCPTEVFEALAPSLRNAFDTIRGLALAERPIDRLLIGRAVLELLRQLATTGPVLLAIDGIEHTDGPSLSALSYALRRAADVPVMLLTSRRTNGGPPPSPGLSSWDDLVSSLGPAVRVFAVPALAPHDIGRLGAERLGVRLSVAEQHEVHERSRGNPLTALRLLAARHDVPDDVLAEPASWSWRETQREVRTLLGGLPPPVRSFVQILALTGQHSVSLALSAKIGAEVGLGADGAAELLAGRRIEGATEVQQLVGLSAEGDALVFRHPLIAEAIAGTISPEVARTGHDILGHWAEPSEVRLRHLALARSTEDRGLAAELARGAARAGERAAVRLAAELAVAAARLTPEDERPLKRERLLVAATRLAEANDPEPALRCTDEAVERSVDDDERADAWQTAATVHADGHGDNTAARACWERVLTLAPPGGARHARARLALAMFSAMTGDFEATTAQLDRVGDPASLASLDPDLPRVARVTRGLIDASRRHVLDEDLVVEARALRDSLYGPRVRYGLGLVLTMVGRIDDGRLVFAELLEETRDANHFRAVNPLLLQLALCDLFTGELRRAEQRAFDVVSRCWPAQPELASEARATAANAQFRLGEFERALRTCEPPAGAPAGADSLRAAAAILFVRAGVAVARRQPAELLTVLGPLIEAAETFDLRDPTHLVWTPAAVEALIGTGDLAAAERLAERHRNALTGIDLVWARTGLADVASQTAAARGHRDEAFAAAEEMVAAATTDPDPFSASLSRWRAHLIARRIRRAVAADRWWRESRAGFEAVGAQGWVARLDDDRPGTTTSTTGTTDATGSLTPTEQTVAELVAAGHTNAAVARELAMSVKTVEHHLTVVYRKLGLRSRTELAARFSTGDSSPA